MDTKRLKQTNRSKGVRPKMDNRDAEVFVLPPDLLQKLGIHLGGIDSIRDSEAATVIQKGIINGTEQTLSAQKRDLIKGDDTILETASLMKKSVLLSPTFISTSSTIPGEVEISGIIEESHQLCDNDESENSVNNMIVIPENIQMTNENALKITKNHTETVHTEYSQNTSIANEYHDASECGDDIMKILEQGNIVNNFDNTDKNNFGLDRILPQQEENVMNGKHVVLDQLNKLSQIDNHFDDVYSSDCSNSNLGLVEHLNNSCNIPPNNSKAQTFSNKINIISEEIIEPSRLRDLKILQSPNRMALTQVTIKSVLTRNKNNDSVDPVKEDGYFQIKNPCGKTQSTKCLNISAQVSDPRNDVKNVYDSGIMTSVDMSTSKENYDLNQNSTGTSVIIQEKPTNKYESGFQHFNHEFNNVVPSENQGSIRKSMSNKNIFWYPTAQCNEINIKSNPHINNDFSSADDCCKNDVNQGNIDEIVIKEKQIIAENIDMSVTNQSYKDNSEMKQVNKEISTIILQNANGDKERSDCVHEIVNVPKSAGEESTNITIATNDNIADNRSKTIGSNIPFDKVEEIGSLLRKFVKRFNKDKTVGQETVNDKKFPVKSNIMTNKTKLCIQGVEKPGGTQEGNKHKIASKYMKTYQRSKRQMQPSLNSTVIVNSNNDVVSKDFKVAENLSILTMSDSCDIQEYCICCDFGRFDYYDCDSLYQHIHFWEQKLTGCNPEIIFSIYNDDSILEVDYSKDYENNSTKEHIDDINMEESGSINICWKGDNADFMKNIVLLSQDLGMSQSSQIRTATNYSSIGGDISKKEDIGGTLIEIKNNEDQVLDVSKDKYKDEIESNLNSMEYENQYDETSHKNKEKYDPEVLRETNVEEPILVSGVNKLDCEMPVLRRPSHSDKKTYKRKHAKQSLSLETKEDFKSKKSDEVCTKSPNKTNLRERNETTSGLSNKSKIINEPPISLCDNKIKNDLEELPKSTISDKNIHDSSTLEVADDNVKVQNMTELLSEPKYIPSDQNNKSKDKTSDASNKNKSIHHIEKRINKNVKEISKTKRKSKNFGVITTLGGEDKNDEMVSIITSLNSSVNMNPKAVCHEENQSKAFTKSTPKVTDKDKTDKTNLLKNASVFSRSNQNIADDSLLTSNDNNVSNALITAEESSDEALSTLRYKNKNVHLTSNLTSKRRIKRSSFSHSTPKKTNKTTDLNSTTMTKESALLKDKTKKAEEASKSTPRDKNKNSSSKFNETEGKIKNKKEVCESESKNKNADMDFRKASREIKSKDLNSTPKDKNKKISSKLPPNDKNESIELPFKSNVGKKHKHVDADSLSTPRKRNKITDEVHPETSKLNKNPTTKSYKKNKNTDLEPLPKPNDNHKNVTSDNAPTPDKKKKVDLNSSSTINMKNKDSGTTSTDNINARRELPSTSKQTENLVTTEKSITCGVCKEVLLAPSWIGHIAEKHNYLAWEDGTPALQFNKEEVNQHLNKISKENGGLICSKCGFVRKYVKSFLHHLKACGIDLPINQTVNDSVDDSITETNTSVESIKGELSRIIKCGVCHEGMDAVDWISHIQKKHNYMAWIDGETPLDMDDEEQVQKHLLAICRENGGLVCLKCGLVRKYVKLYLQHVQTCEEINDDEVDGDTPSTKNKEVQCGVCSETMSRDKWKPHAMSKHYNIAWIVGKAPIDLRNGYAVEKYLKEYKEKCGKMVCKICKISRVSYSGFYAHILTCGKTDEETEMFKDTCEICNSKYLCIYKSPHMAAHREQANAKERKLKLAEKKENSQEMINVEVTPGRRKAAEKAKSVIEKYKSNMNDSKHTCPKCGFGTDREEELAGHECTSVYAGYSSDSDVSVKLEQCSDDESLDTDVDSFASEEEEAADKKKRHHKESRSLANKVERIPFNVKNTNSYLKESYDEFCKTHLTNATLFPQWHDTEYEPVLDEEVVKYLPPLKNSCKVKFNDDCWTEYNRFEATGITDCHVLFAGASVQCTSWAPAHLDDKSGNCGLYLAVATHSGVDQPRIRWQETISHAGLLQIWDAGDFKKKLPKLVLGLAHDYGTVWAMDWCPSGARDLLPINQEDFEVNKKYRLGLLAVVCSNGAVYIFSIPYPSTITEKDKLFYKLKPKVELRLSSHADREKCQATSVCWSTQKDHAIVIVGYSDGTSAFYDLQNESQILKTVENGVTIYSPFHDERSQNSSVSGVSMYPCGDLDEDGECGAGGVGVARGARWCGAWCSASVSGARLSSGAAAAHGAAVHSYMAAGGATFSPLWPSVLLAGDDCVVNQSVNELEWFGGGRRLGAVRAWCAGAGGSGAGGGGGARCRLLAAAPPLLRIVRAHPLHGEITKEMVGTIQMAPIAKKRKRKQSNDELSMKLEPLAYDDAVKQYGIQLNMFSVKDNAAQQKALSLPTVHYPERYPLADVTSMAFCPFDKYDKKVALATHAGVIFLTDV